MNTARRGLLGQMWLGGAAVLLALSAATQLLARSTPTARWVAATALAVLLVGLAGAGARTASATGFVVDSTSDASLIACTPAPGDCSLRGAIENANLNAAADSITFDPGTFPGTIVLGSALPSLTAGSDTVDGSGMGVVVDGVTSSFDCFTLGSASNLIYGMQITGCSTGVMITGTDNAVGSTAGTTPGGACTGSCNVISGNSTGVAVVGLVAGNDVIANHIGVDAAGSALGNSQGVALIATGTTIDGNVISSNTINGILAIGGGSGNVVTRNKIGTDPAGSAARPNSNNGIQISGPDDNVIGIPGAGNVIAFNGVAGVCVTGATTFGNSIRGNSIHSNGGLGVDLVSSGSCTTAAVQANDAGDPDTGPNHLQNYPGLAIVDSTALSTRVDGSLNSTPSTSFTLDFYSDASCDASGHGEGRVYLGSLSGVATDGSGDVLFTATGLLPVPVGHAVSATATRESAPLETSEFGLCTDVTLGVENGRWAAVYSRTSPSAGLDGECIGDVNGPHTAITNSPPHPWPWFCEVNHTLTGASGTLSATMLGSGISGSISFGCCPSPYTSSFFGTVAPDGLSSTGFYTTTSTSGTYESVLTTITAGTPGETVTGQEGSSLTFGGASAGGYAAIITSSTSAGTLPGSFSLVGQYYHVMSTSGAAPYLFCGSYPGGVNTTNDIVSGTLETNLQIGHLETGGWSFEPRAPESDPLTNTVCASVSSLSEFAVVAPCDGDSDGVCDAIDNCPAIANPTQKNSDTDQFGDACDNCPTVVNPAQMNSDGDTLGNDCDNCPTVTNADQANADGDEYGDACEQPQCVTVINHWVVPAGDADCDGYPSSAVASGKAPESFVGTEAADKCANTPAANDEPSPDAWPVDFNDDQKATIIDISFYSSRFGAVGPNAPYAVRYDLNADNRLSIIDVSQYSAFFGKLCAP